MLTAFLAAFAAAQISPADLAAPPPLYPERRPRPACACPAEAPANLTAIEGLVVDAEVTLGADGRSVNDRQATIFEVASGINPGGRVKIWHSTIEAQCGVTFEYGRKYKIVARQDDEGLLETDACLTPPSKL